MPAQFPQSFRDSLTAFNGTTGGAVSFASRLVTLLNAAFGASNPFGTAATKDTGTTADNVPVLGADGTLPLSILPTANTTNPGLVTLASGLSDTSPTAVVTPPQVNALVGNLTQGFRVDRTEITALTLNNTFTTPGSGWLIMSGGGRGGTGVTGNIRTQGVDGENLTVQYGAASATGFTSSSPTLIARGGSAGANVAFGLVTIDAAATTAGRAPRFAFNLGNSGASGGRGGFISPDVSGDISNSGDLLIAFIEGAGKFIRMTTDGTGGAGGNVGSPSATRANGEAGANGFAFFIRVD